MYIYIHVLATIRIFVKGGRIYWWWIEGGRKREESEMRDEEHGKDVEEESRGENERETYDK